ncbi:Arf family guanine nucleotide exchange factor SEC7 [Sugiyamaella lignohabitans]|uniref:Arf family guanine nucleotide exchange factor SEC7 n=1 Tax=Sugiyamaella lignohabitans TaxID=796027 RepID=A0A167CM35_9ASCO|nr:Arf family guanine nucleotide exchange factor SEC7 [Sugiyamaella lignohabitans]ANB11875.1 Arf family guanine nucleotide exchange factor SEC7 [Sugiyamaella lignohabitans]
MTPVNNESNEPNESSEPTEPSVQSGSKVNEDPLISDSKTTLAAANISNVEGTESSAVYQKAEHPTTATDDADAEGVTPEPYSTNSTATDLTGPSDHKMSPSSSLSSIHAEGGTSASKSSGSPAGPQTPVQSINKEIIEGDDDKSTDSSPSVAKSLYQHTATFVNEDEYASWLGSDGETQQAVRVEYMSLFDFKSKSILSALRILCDKLYMKGESQQLNRVIEAFSQSWVSQNPKHGFYDANVVYTITYALVLLNTDLYAADHSTTKKMSRSVFIQNTLETVRAQRGPLPNSPNLSRRSEDFSSRRISVVSSNHDTLMVQDANVEPLSKEWEFQLEMVLKSFYSSVSKEALQLHIIEHAPFSPLSRIYSPTGHDHTPSILSASQAQNSGASSIFGRMNFGRLRGSKNLEPHQSRIALNDRAAEGFRHDSLASSYSLETSVTNNFGFSRHAVGFAGLLWNSMIKEEDSGAQSTGDDDDFADFSKIEKELADETELELLGAPWAKEGILMYRPYVDPSTGKKPRKKDWTKVFMVVQRGQLKMFKFDMSSSSHGAVNGAVGGGNWMENAQLVDGFHLCHTMAQELPPPKKSNGFAAVWSLTLPQRGLLVFQAGTPEVAREFVYTCNFWAGRLSKEPFDDPVSNMEYGWTAALDSSSGKSGSALMTTPSTATLRRPGSSAGHRVLPGDRLTIKEWKPTGHNMVVSDLNEEKQLKTLQEYIKRAENDLTEHNALVSKLAQAYTPSTTNWSKAHTNWENKSQFLLQQVIRYKIYVEVLDKAIKDRLEKFPVKSETDGDAQDDLTVSDGGLPVKDPSLAVFDKGSPNGEKFSSVTVEAHQVIAA